MKTIIQVVKIGPRSDNHATATADRPHAAHVVITLHLSHRGPQAPRLTGAQPERTSHMDAPPREQRARAAFFREKEARRVAKKQRKKERLLAKVAQAAKAADVAPPPPQTYSSGK